MAATKMFLIKWYSSSTNLEVFQIWKTSGTTYLLVVWKSSGSHLEEVVWTSRKSSGLPGSRLDFQEVVWTSRKSSGLLGSRLDFSERFGFSDLENFWDDLLVSRLEVIWKSSGSRLDFLKVVWTSCKVVWTSCKVVWKSSELPKSLLAKSSKSSELLKSCLVLSTQVESKLVFTTYNSVVHETTEIISEKNPGRLTIKSSGGRLNYKSSVRLKCKSSGEVKLLKLSIDDLTFSRLRLQISKSIAKITSALTRRLPGKSSTARRLKGKSSTARRLPNEISSLAYIRLLQAHRITNGSHPPIIVSFYDSMNHENFRIKMLSFFSSLWRESERYVVFRSQEWKKKKGKSILGALRASNWLFMVVVVLMTMAIL
ncbi:hypothetical protein IGI04_007147 [Brassica rapa subsp. trilocularis]|uniref:Uncharacterized protein n=1 Tax=Brassica rapa subsp. trilocularis TaxID=1813537 RepID=A0ABQ7NIX4_BRACM|nr:hypothetical protein IGI04_007147 [Brassica rapa subsp. trilocularis]